VGVADGSEAFLAGGAGVDDDRVEDLSIQDIVGTRSARR